jgi:hypothetical protein
LIACVDELSADAWIWPTAHTEPAIARMASASSNLMRPKGDTLLARDL